MMNTSHGFVPWDDLHHVEMSQTNGEIDGRWVFGNGNNTPRIGRVLIARGRDACDVALSSTFGPNTLEGFRVWTDVVDAGTSPS